MIRLSLIAGIATMLLGGCTLTNEKGDKVVLTTQNAFPLILAEMKKGCPDLVAAGNAAAAISSAVQASQQIQGAIGTVNNMASIGCSLLVPAPAAP